MTALDLELLCKTDAECIGLYEAQNRKLILNRILVERHGGGGIDSKKKVRSDLGFFCT